MGVALPVHDPLRARMPERRRQVGTTRTYGYQRAASSVLGVGLLIWFAVELAHVATEPLPRDHGPIPLLVAVLVLAAALPVGVLIMSQRLGIHLTDRGVESVSVDGKSFTPWSQVQGFRVGPAPWIRSNLTVHLLRLDGTTTPLTRFGEWPFWRKRTQALCDALNQELAFERAR
jgi:hypothetical protein